MKVVHLVVSLLLEGALWTTAVGCLLHAAGKISEGEFKRWFGFAWPVWIASSLFTLVWYASEAFIAVYGANEYEGGSLLGRGHVLGQSALFIQISVSIFAYLTPALLLIRALRSRPAVVYLVSTLCFLSLVVFPRFQKEEPNQAIQPPTLTGRG